MNEQKTNEEILSNVDKVFITPHEYQEIKSYENNDEIRSEQLKQIRLDQEQGLIKDTISHADSVIKDTSNIKGLQNINLANNFLLVLPKKLLDKLTPSKQEKLHDTMVGMVLDYDKEEEQGNSRKLKRKGSVISSILVTAILMTLGIIAAIIFLK